MMLCQYPLRGPWRGYPLDDASAARFKLRARRLEVDIPVDASSETYDAEAPRHRRIEHLTLRHGPGAAGRSLGGGHCPCAAPRCVLCAVCLPSCSSSPLGCLQVWYLHTRPYPCTPLHPMSILPALAPPLPSPFHHQHHISWTGTPYQQPTAPSLSFNCPPPPPGAGKHTGLSSCPLWGIRLPSAALSATPWC